jgi:hypothetical protein
MADKCLPEELMSRLRSGAKTLDKAGRPRRGARAAKQASAPAGPPPTKIDLSKEPTAMSKVRAHQPPRAAQNRSPESWARTRFWQDDLPPGHPQRQSTARDDAFTRAERRVPHSDRPTPEPDQAQTLPPWLQEVYRARSKRRR